VKKNFSLIIQVVLGIGAYYILSYYIDNIFLLLGVFVVIGMALIIIKSLYIRNPAEVLEILVNPQKHFETIKRFELRDPNKYNTLYAYGLTYTGEYEEAQVIIDKVFYKDIKTSANLHYVYYVVKLHLAYNNKDRELYKETLEKAKGLGVFEKVDVLNGAFEAHSLILEGYSEEAEELLKKVIPKIQKKVLVIELEYLLALAYANQGKTDDCKAVCEFISERNRQVVHTILCKELLDTIS